MKPVGFKESNFVLGKPESMTDEECDQLPVFRDSIHCVSCWKLTPEEMKLIQETGCIYLGVLAGGNQPPVFLQVENPFVNA